MAPQPRLVGVDPELPATHWRKRLRCVTMQWYTSVMGTGGLAFLLDQLNVAYGGGWLLVLGKIVFIFNIVLFVGITFAIIGRIALHPPAAKHMVLHPQESNFLCCFPLALATLVASAAAYGAPSAGTWLIKTCLVFWIIYVVLGLLCAIIGPLLQWTVQEHPLREFVPLWLLPPLGIVFNGAVAYEIIQRLPPYEAIWVLLWSYVMLGFGSLIGLLYSSGWIIRLLAYGPPPPASAPVFCLVIGPISWAAYGLIALGMEAERVFPTAYPTPFLGSEMSGQIFGIASLCLGMFLWGLGWFFTSTALVYLLYGAFSKRLAVSSGALNNWGLTFPLTGQVSVAFILGTRFESRFMTDFAIVQTVVWIFLWLFALLTTVNGLLHGKIAAEGCDVNVPMLGYDGDYEKVDEDDAEKRNGHANGHDV